MADRQRTRCGALCEAPLDRLFAAPVVARAANGLLPGDVPAVQIGRHSRDFTHPAGPPGRIVRDSSKGLRPGVYTLETLKCHDAGARFHGPVPFGERPGHFGIGDTACPWDEPR